jgi:hypothetical protein
MEKKHAFTYIYGFIWNDKLKGSLMSDQITFSIPSDLKEKFNDFFAKHPRYKKSGWLKEQILLLLNEKGEGSLHGIEASTRSPQ